MSTRELFEAIPFQILEQKEVTEGGQRRLRVRGIFHRADERNANNRIYPQAILERETKKMNDRIAKGETVFMQADHPSDGTSRIGDTTAILRHAAFDPKTNEVMGEADIIATRKGEDLAQIIKSGGRIGISARGFGTTKPGEWAGNKGEVVQEDYQLVTYDFVVGQSTRGAVVTNFAEQARVLAGLEGENKDMDLKTLDFEQLKAARPDLITTIEKGATEAAKKSAKEEAEKTVNAMIAEKTKEIEDKIRKEMAEKMMTAKEKAAMEDEKDSGKDDDEENADGTKKKKNEQEQKLRAEAKKLGLDVVKAGNTKVEGEITTLRTQLNEVTASFQKLEKTQQELVEQSQAVEVHKYILEKTKDEKKYRNGLIERLIKNCKNKEEVDAKYEAQKGEIDRLLNEATGSGVTAKDEEKGGAGGTEKTFKTKDGKMLTEMQIRSRTLSGLKTELAE